MAFRSGGAPRRKGGKDSFEPLEVYPAQVLNNHIGAINQILLQANTLVTSSSDGKITVWDYDRKSVVHEFRGDSKRLFMRGPLLFCVAFGAFGNEPGEVNVYDWKRKQFVACYKGHTLFITDCLLFEDVIVTASADQTVRVWDAVVQFEGINSKSEERASRRVLQGHSGIVNCLLWSGGYVWSGSADQTIKAWNIQTANCAITLSGHSGSVMCLESSKDMIYSGAADSTIRTWDPRTQNCLSTIKLKGSITQILYHSDHLFCLSSAETAITQVHPKTGKVVRRLEGHTGKVLVMKATLHNLYTGSEDGMVRRWNINTGTCWSILKGHKDRIHSLFTPSASSLLSGSADTNAIFWDVLRHDDVDEEEKWFQKTKAQDQKDQDIYANLVKQRLNAQKAAVTVLPPPPAVAAPSSAQKAVMNTLAPPPALVAPPTLPLSVLAAVPAAITPTGSPAKREDKVSALDFLSEPMPANTPKHKKGTHSGNSSGRSTPSTSSPAHERPIAASGSASPLTPTAPTGSSGRQHAPNTLQRNGSGVSLGSSPLSSSSDVPVMQPGARFVSWPELIEAAKVDSHELSSLTKLDIAEWQSYKLENYTGAGVKIGNALRLMRFAGTSHP